MASDRPQVSVPLTAAGDFRLSSLIKSVAQNPEVGDPDALTPTDGRVVEDSTDGTVYVGDGSQFAAVDTAMEVAHPRVGRAWVIRSVEDLPAPVDGEHVLTPGDVYLFADMVVSSATLNMTSAAVRGWHGSATGFVHTGGSAALKVDGGSFMMASIYAHAPGGTVFDLTGSATDEFLCESATFSDAAGLGEAASLGVIDGFRVPAFKGCNFEDFAEGLTFTGTPDKIFFNGCPLRGVTEAGGEHLTLDANFDCEIIDMTDNYVKEIQADTNVVHVDEGATISEIFQYRGNTHGDVVDRDNILTGAAGTREIGYRVSDSYPLSDSGISAELSIDEQGTVDIQSQDAYTLIDIATSPGPKLERVSLASPGVLQYDGKRDFKARVELNTTCFAGTNTYAIAIGKNGTAKQSSEMRAVGRGGSTPVPMSTSTLLELTTGDQVAGYVQNLSNSSDIDFVSMNLTVQD